MTASTKLEVGFDRAKFMRQRSRLRAMATRAQDVSPAWDAVLTWFAEQNFEQFLTRGQRYGKQWTPLALSTLDEKRHHGFPLDPLIRTGRMANSLSHRPLAIEHITPHEVIGGTDVPYAPFHQRGTRRMPQRELFNAARIRREQAATTAVANWIIRGQRRVGGRSVIR